MRAVKLQTENARLDFVGAAATAILAAFALIVCIPNYIDNGRDPIRSCQANLRTIDGLKASWALEIDSISNAIPTDADLFGYDKYIREKPMCPAGGTYTLGSVNQKPHCSIPDHTI